MERRALSLWRWIAVIAAAGLLSGCATAAQRQARAMAANDHAAFAAARQCIAALYNSADYAPLRRHLPAPGTEPSLQQETDSSLVTDDEIKAIYLTHPKGSICEQHLLSQIGVSTPTFVPILGAEFDVTENHLIALVQRKESWGDYIRQGKAVGDEARARLIAEGQRINAGLERSNEAELARRQAAAAAFSQFLQRQETINAMNRPVTTNCNAFGNSLNCVTR